MKQTNKKLCPKCFAIIEPGDVDCTCNVGFKMVYYEKHKHVLSTVASKILSDNHSYANVSQ